LITKHIHKLKQSSLFKDSFWSVLGNVAGHGLALIAGIIIARFLGKEIFGEYGMIKATLLNIAVFSTFGLGFTATKFIAEAKNKAQGHILQIVKGSMSITLVTSISFALLLFIFSKQIAVYLNAEHLSFALRIFAVNIVFNAISTVQIGILAGFKAFKQIAINNGIAGIATFTLSVALTYYWGLEGALTALLLATMLRCVLNGLVVQKKVQVCLQTEEKTSVVTKQLLSFSLPIALHEGVQSFTGWLLVLLLLKLTNFGEVALYSISQQWAMVVLFVPGVLRNVTLSHLSNTNDNSTQNKKVFKTMIAINFLATFVPFLIVFSLSSYIASFYGNDFADLPKVLNIAVFTSVINALSSVYRQDYIAKNMNWTMFGIKLFRDVGIFMLIYFFLHIRQESQGAYYVALSMLIMYALALILMHCIYVINQRKKQ